MYDLDVVREAASRVEVDLRATLGPSWRCWSDENFTVTVSDGRVSESVLLENSDWHSAERSRADAELRDADVFASLTSEATEILRVLGHDWPLCAVHGQVLDSCDDLWTCSAGSGHVVAPVGSLTLPAKPPALE